MKRITISDIDQESRRTVTWSCDFDHKDILKILEELQEEAQDYLDRLYGPVRKPLLDRLGNALVDGVVNITDYIVQLIWRGLKAIWSGVVYINKWADGE